MTRSLAALAVLALLCACGKYGPPERLKEPAPAPPAASSPSPCDDAATDEIEVCQ